MKNRSAALTRSVTAVLVIVVFASCSSSGPVRESAAPIVVAGDTIATVDGVAITRADLELATAATPSPHGGGAPVSSEAMLERLIDRELLAQRATAEHLDRDAAYRRELSAKMAQLQAWKRERLAELYETELATRRPELSEADARQYYDANAARIRTEVRVAQILVRDEARANQALAELRAGATFDEVAARQLPNVPDVANKPWELPFFQWNQIPEPWRPVIDGIAVGQTSEVISGPNRRFWIIKVLERRENPEHTFEATQTLITTLLQQQRITEARATRSAEIRRGAHIVRLQPAPAAAPAPAPDVEP